MTGSTVEAPGRQRRAVGRFGFRVPELEERFESRMVELPGRGSTLLTDTGTPPDRPDAPTIVLLHALACTGLLNWYPAIGGLAAHYRVVTFDQRWHGQGIRRGPFRLDDAADDVAAVLDHLAIDRALLCGYSMGGLVSQLAWHRHPERVAGLVLCATACWFGRLSTVQAGLNTAGRILLAFERDERSGPVERPHRNARDWAFRQFRQTSAREISMVTGELVRFDSRAWLPDVDVPAAVVLTLHDGIIPPERQLDMARLLPDVAVYPARAGHAGCVLQADRFVPALDAAVAHVANR